MVSKVVSVSKTRPADTTTYASGDVVDAGTGTGLTFSEIVRTPGATGVLMALQIVDSANQTLKPVLELWLFNTALTFDNDNAAFTPTDAELATLVAILPLTGSYVGDATSGAGGNVVYTSTNLAIPFQCAANERALYGVLVTRNAYVPVASEVFTVTLRVLQD